MKSDKPQAQTTKSSSKAEDSKTNFSRKQQKPQSVSMKLQPQTIERLKKISTRTGETNRTRNVETAVRLMTMMLDKCGDGSESDVLTFTSNNGEKENIFL